MEQTLKTLADFTSATLMVPELHTRTATGVIAELCSMLQRQGRLSDSARFYDAVLRRELLCTTAIEPGWALPHARLKEISQLSFALARSSQPLVWLGGLGPQTVFLFAVPEAEAKTYLNVVSAVARLTQSPALLEQLRRAPDGEAMFAVLRQVLLCQRELDSASLMGSSIHV